MHKALGDAVKFGLVASNVTAYVEAPKRKYSQPELWQPGQIQIFVGAMLEDKGGYYGNLFLFLLASGCRIGEALGLKTSDIDTEKGIIRIERQLVEVRGRWIESVPKTNAGFRKIAIPSFGVEALRK